MPHLIVARSVRSNALPYIKSCLRPCNIMLCAFRPHALKCAHQPGGSWPRHGPVPSLSSFPLDYSLFCQRSR